ncbi:Stress responsive A/B Barrel Domain [Cyclobacterium lianum]|uniref:Stress responsive A/B Barrel Domain n=1 Tax=Cyclobacterium lianum TaxID=388280 RepID=A0A1M7QRV7_9BACT|nr:Dabb family protein [Cyclobacterium lianum]SHN34105.1 Stress responsive A/B Barrel Domain [Cyclobacterium lianum]
MYKFFSIVLLSMLAIACQSGNKSEEIVETETVEMEQNVNDEPMLRHVVLLSFKEESTEEDIKKVENAFIALKDKIPQIKDFEWGTNNSPEGLNKGLTHCFLVTFGSEADREVYLPHPEHQAFVEVLSPHMKDVTVVDYWAK